MGLDAYLLNNWEMLIGRDYGPLTFRFIMQPSVAALLAIRAGLRDARARKPAYGWTVAVDPAHRSELLRHGWKDVRQLFATAIIIDIIYELIVFRWIYPGQVLIVATTLAFPTYIVVRGLANRLTQWSLKSGDNGNRWTGRPGFEGPSVAHTTSNGAPKHNHLWLKMCSKIRNVWGNGR
jgi:hypothetical protein